MRFNVIEVAKVMHGKINQLSDNSNQNDCSSVVDAMLKHFLNLICRLMTELCVKVNKY